MSSRSPGKFDPKVISVEEERTALSGERVEAAHLAAGGFDLTSTAITTADGDQKSIAGLAANLKPGDFIKCFCPFHANSSSPSASVGVTETGTPFVTCFSDVCDRTYWPVGRWPALVPFGGSDLASFPVEVLPAWLADYVNAVATFTQTPADMAAMLSISSLAVACGGKFIVEPKPGWTEPLCLFTATAMPPGSRKSAVFSAITKPIRDYERALVEAAGGEIATKSAEQTLAKDMLKQVEAKAAKVGGEEDRDRMLKEAAALRVRIVDLEPPPVPRLLADDVTSEALAGLLAIHGGRMAVASAEGGIFETMAGRYSASVSIDVYLKGHAGDELRVDRRSRAPEYVKSPCLTIALAVQPSVIASLADKPGFRGRGLLARFLYALPEGLVGRRRIDAPPIPDTTASTYTAKITALLAVAVPTTPATLSFSPDASRQLQAFWGRLEPRLLPGGGLDGVQDWASKLWGAVPRLAGLLHLAEYAGAKPMPPVVGVGPVRAAIRIAEDHLVGHALAAFDLMAADERTADAKHLLRWLRSTRPAKFTKREAHKANEGRFRKVAGLEAALAALVERGFVRKVKTQKRGPGRRSEVYEVNPSFVAANIDRIDRTPTLSSPTLDSVDSVDSVPAVRDTAGSTPDLAVEADGAADGVVATTTAKLPDIRPTVANPKTSATDAATGVTSSNDAMNVPYPPPSWPNGIPPWTVVGSPEWKEQEELMEAACASLDD